MTRDRVDSGDSDARIGLRSAASLLRSAVSAVFYFRFSGSVLGAPLLPTSRMRRRVRSFVLLSSKTLGLLDNSLHRDSLGLSQLLSCFHFTYFILPLFPHCPFHMLQFRTEQGYQHVEHKMFWGDARNGPLARAQNSDSQQQKGNKVWCFAERRKECRESPLKLLLRSLSAFVMLVAFCAPGARCKKNG